MQAFRVCFEIALVIAPHIGYVAQYVEVHRTRSIEGYAPIVSLILLTSNTLRVYYYIGRRFLLALLCQAIVGIAVHGALLLKVLEVHMDEAMRTQISDLYSGNSATVIMTVATGTPTVAATSNATTGGAARKQNSEAGYGDDTTRSPQTGTPALEWPTSSSDAFNGLGGSGGAPPPSRPSTGIKSVAAKFMRLLFSIEDCIEAHLLRHTPLQFFFSYVITAAFALAIVLLYYVSIGSVWKYSANVVGYTALGIEALLVLPQILRNARRRSTEGLSMLLVLTWVSGDVLKVFYFIYAKQSLPFVLCGSFQALLDVVLVSQLVYYRFILKRDNEMDAEGEGNG